MAGSSMASKPVDSITCTPRSSEEQSDRGVARVESDSSLSSNSAELALGALRTTKDTSHVAITSRPLSSSLLDHCVYVWIIITHLFVTFFPYIGLAIIAGALYSTACAYICAILLGTLLLPRCPHVQHLVDIMDVAVFSTWRRAVQLKVIHSAEFDPNQQYLLAGFPHGAFPLAAQLHASVWPRVSASQLKILVANVLFKVPIWRHYMSVGGCIPASKSSLHQTLKSGDSALVLVGGIAEMFMLERDREIIMLQKRRGFVRAALEAGVPILPVYYFGQSKVLNFGPKILAGLSRRFRASIGFVYGPWGMPTPRNMPITAVVGEPVAVDQVSCSDPKFEEHVDEVHTRYTAALTQLYEDHRKDYSDGCQSWRSRPLQVV